jgi:trehalose-phosphatase
VPAPLPSGLIARLAGHEHIFLCLDYDGTLAPIVDDPRAAWPTKSAREALCRLSGYASGDFGLAIISGRDLNELQRLLGIDRGLLMVGAHGTQIQCPDGQRKTFGITCEVTRSLAAARRWLDERVDPRSGLWVEDKEVALALHYRRAEPSVAEPVVAAFESFIKSNGAGLSVKRGKMVIEAAPVTANKGAAITRLLDKQKSRVRPVYFGDDLTDEDAFAVVNAAGGVTIRVGAGPSEARYMVESTAAVADELIRLAIELERRAKN